MIQTLLTWLDAHPPVYWWMGCGALGLVAAWSWLAGRSFRDRAMSWRNTDMVSVAMLLVLLLAWRWPGLLEKKPDSGEESRIIAGAMALAKDAVPYQSANLGVAGLLAGLVLLPSHWLGIPQDYFNARFVALMLDWGTLAIGYLYFRQRWRMRGALLAILPVALILATYGVHTRFGYAPWHLGLFLTALSALLLWRLGRNQSAGWADHAVVVVAAFSLGCIPWCSRAALPVAVVLWGAAALCAKRSAGPTGGLYLRRLKQVGALTLYGNLAMLCLIHGVGQWHRFWISYVCGGTEAGAGGWDFSDVTLWRAGLALAVLVDLVSRLWSWPAGRSLLGTVFVAGLVLGEHVRSGTPQGFGHFAEDLRSPDAELVKHLRAMRRPNDELVVWGNSPHLYVETGIRPGVSSIDSIGEIADANPQRQHFRDLYLAEMRTGQPRFFVDAESAAHRGGEGRTKSEHEIFPQLAEFINDYYRLESDDGRMRLYDRHVRTVTDVKPSDLIPISLEKVRVIHATGSLSDMGEGRWLAHAPSRFAYALPTGARFLGGAYGFIAGAYQNPGAATDGATFLIEAVASDGRREILLQRRLNPVANPADRGPMAFSVEVPSGTGWQVEFTVEPGEGNGFDWTYWQGLECILRGTPAALSK